MELKVRDFWLASISASILYIFFCCIVSAPIQRIFRENYLVKIWCKSVQQNRSNVSSKLYLYQISDNKPWNKIDCDLIFFSHVQNKCNFPLQMAKAINVYNFDEISVQSWIFRVIFWCMFFHRCSSPPSNSINYLKTSICDKTLRDTSHSWFRLNEIWWSTFLKLSFYRRGSSNC